VLIIKRGFPRFLSLYIHNVGFGFVGYESEDEDNICCNVLKNLQGCTVSKEKTILSLPWISHIPFTHIHGVSKHNVLLKRFTVVRDVKNY